MIVKYVLVCLLAELPFFAPGIRGVKRIDFTRGVWLEVIQTDTTVHENQLDFNYTVQGIRITSSSSTDTLFWISQTPSQALVIARTAEIRSFSERRTLEILALTEYYIGGIIKVITTRNSHNTTHFTALRTWLLDGSLLDLESVVQVDDLFLDYLSVSLNTTVDSLENYLWSRGFWMDPQSFIIVSGNYSQPVLRLGFPSWQGSDDLLLVDLNLSELNSAMSAMMD